MAVFAAFLSRKEKKYKVASCTEDAVGLSVDSDTKFVEGDQLSQHGQHTLNTKSRPPRYIVVVLLVSLALNVGVSIYIWTCGGQGNTKPDPPKTAPIVSAVHEDSLCTECQSLGLNPDYHRLGDYHEVSVLQLEDVTYLCCLHNVASLKRLIQLFSDKSRISSPSNLTDQTYSGSGQTTGAHLFIDRDALRKTPPSLSWTTEFGFGSAFSNGVVVHDNQLMVTRPGLYHVYSFFTFKTRQRRQKPDNILHTVYRQNKHLPRLGSHVMLLDKTTLPEADERFVTSFLSATVRLRKDDQLFVKVSNLSYVYAYSPSNFFGLYFIGE